MSSLTAERWAPCEGDWSNRAACLEEDPELFFPIGEGRAAQLQVEKAVVVCARCPVRTPCLTFALRANVPYGVWGGTVPDERTRMKRRMAIVGSKTRIATPDRIVRAPALGGS